ncbi:MAG: hypothetical protein C4289_00920 [Chloroflexota bacterium]
MEPIRLGMIGCGQISEKFFRQAAQLAGVEFVATCAAHEESARRKAEEKGIRRWYTDYQELLRQDDIDGVVITTPHSLHARMARDAALAGKHALVEKPVATRWDEAVEMVEAFERADRVLVALPFDRYTHVTTGLSYIKEEYIGKVIAIDAQFSLPGPPRSNWYYTRAISHGGAMLDTAPYALTRIAEVMGPATRVAAFANTLIPQRLCGDGGRVYSDVDDNVTVILEYEGGQQAILRSCWAYSYIDRSVIVHGRHGDVFWNTAGEPLIVRSTLKPVPRAEPVRFLGLDHCYRPVIPPQTVEQDVMAEFVHCIRTGERPTAHGRLALHVIEQLMKAYESAITGQILPLETTFESWWQLEPGLFDLKGQWL